jgi:DtxR family Mn-dependent transcriptional regulator
MTKNKELSDSLEDYLEAIYKIVDLKQAARAKDIAEYLNVNSASVTGALRSLSKKGFINYTPYDVITLTAKGNKFSKEIVRRHEALSDFFTTILHIDEKEAEETACGMEHSISKNVLDRLLRFTDFLQNCPRGGDSLIKKIWESCELREKKKSIYENCEQCISGSLIELQEKKQIRKVKVKNIELFNVNSGKKVKLIKMNEKSGVKQRLDYMGIVAGDTIEVINFSPLGDSMDIKCRGYYINLREDEAIQIFVQEY